MTVGSFVKELLIQDVVKRRQPTKHYVYQIKVSWSDGKINVIYRRYSQFFSLQDSIFNAYPEESGVTNPAKRIIPLLPGKIIFGRSQIREVAEKRKDLINEYLQKLIKLPEHISKSTLVLHFLTVTSEDVRDLSRSVERPEKTVKSADNISDPIVLEQYMVVANYKTDGRDQVSLACGDTVEVIEKNDNGWWFVCIEDEQGWAPSSYLEPLNSNREDERGEVVTQFEKYICIKEYNAEQHDELSLKLGDLVVLQIKQRDGWWKVKLHSDVQKEGIVPAVHLKRCFKVCIEESTGEEIKQVWKAADTSFEAGKGVKAPPRQNTVRKVKRKNVQRPSPLKGLKQQASATNDDVEDEEVVYICGSDYEEVDSGGTHLNIKEGSELLVLEKTPNGWWRVKTGTQEGWIPSSLAQRKRRMKSGKGSDAAVTKTNELYSTISTYESNEESGLSFKPDQIVELLEKDPSGWWFVKLGEREGWAPSNFLKKYDTETLQNVKIECPISDEHYENVYIPAPDKTTPLGSTEPPVATKPHVPPKPTDRIKPLRSPTPTPRTRARTDLATAAKMRGNVKQKHERPVSSGDISQYDQVQANRRPLESTYSNIVVMSNDSEKTKGETYIALADYTDTDVDMLCIKAGQLLLVTKKVDNGWWYAELGDQVGWVPSNYLRKN